MTRRALTLWTAAAALTLGVSPAWAAQEKEKPTQDSGGSSVSRPSSGESTGSAVSRPSSDSSGSSAGSASSGGSSSSSMPAGSGSSYRAPRAPERRSRGEQGGQNSSADGSRDRVWRESNGPRGADRVPSADGSPSGAERRAVPAYSRPREGQQPVGSAVERRGGVPVRGNNGGGSYYDPYYDPYYRYGNGYGSRYGYYSGYGLYGYGNYGHGRWFPAYGFGLGYFYDPFSYGYYSPYDSDYGYGGSGGYGGYGRAERYGRTRSLGQLRLKVKPEFGQVYVDGYYVGEVDSFDGAFQRMPIEAGAHRIEIRAAGYQTVGFEVLVNPGETVTYKGELRPIR